jgi:hypothetical protein
MTLPLFTTSSLKEAFAALRSDLLHEDGPKISTMRNYRFAIVSYDPSQEFALRREVRDLTEALRQGGWFVLPLSLQSLFLSRVRSLGEEWVQRVIEMERRTSKIDKDRGLAYLKSKIMPLVEGPDGLAADCARVITEHTERHPDQVDRTLALIGRAGAVYPFIRSSALLRHLDGRTRNVPVVLLYPGERRGPTALSFMGVLDPDSDYRPRIYP